MVPQGGVDRVPRGAGLGRHHGALLAQQTVHQARLPYVRPPHDGHLDQVFGVLFGRLWQQSNDTVEQVAAALSDDGRDRLWVAEAELVERVVRVVLGHVVGLVRGNHDAVAVVTQQLGDLMILRVNAELRVYHEHDHVGLLDGLVDLLPHRLV